MSASAKIRRATAAYYGMVEGIDEDYGAAMAALEHVGQNLDDWIIIYTSDHGEMLGEHRLWEKSKFFEGSVKVPLIIRLPGGANAGRVVEENVNLCDLFATLCELTDVPGSSMGSIAAASFPCSMAMAQLGTTKPFRILAASFSAMRMNSNASAT